MVTKTLTANID